MNERELAQSLIDNYPSGNVTIIAKLFLQADSENKKLREALINLLFSADARWYELDLGHDWKLAVDDATKALEGAKTDE